MRWSWLTRPSSAWCASALEVGGFAGSITQVIAVEVPDRPGGLAGMLELLDASSVNVEYLYCFLRPGAETAVDIVRVEDPETATRVLRDAGFSLPEPSSIYEP
jgi:hypothetical protein